MVEKQEEGPRYDDYNRRLCHAHRFSDKEPCRSPAMAGQKVCRMHGGSTRKARNAAKLRLMDLVDPAITVLAKELVSKDANSRDRQSAANSILDRSGIGRQSEVTVDDAREMLMTRMQEIRKEQKQAERNAEGYESD